MHNVGFPSTLCLALVIVPLLASVATSYPSPEFEELENPVAELPDKRGWTNFNGGYGKRGWNSFQGGYGKRAFDYDEDADLSDEIQAEKRAWNSGFAGGMGKRAWNSGFAGGMGKRAWNSNFNGGMGKRAWNSNFNGGMGKRAWNSNFNGGMGKRAWNSFNGGYGKRALEISEDVLDSSDPDEEDENSEEAEVEDQGKIKNDPQFSSSSLNAPLKKVDSMFGLRPAASYEDDSDVVPDTSLVDGEEIPQFVPSSNDGNEKNSDLIRVKSKKRWIDGITALWGKKKRGASSNQRKLWTRGNRNINGNGSEDERIKRRYVLMTPHQYHALKALLVAKRTRGWLALRGMWG